MAKAVAFTPLGSLAIDTWIFSDPSLFFWTDSMVAVACLALAKAAVPPPKDPPACPAPWSPPGGSDPEPWPVPGDGYWLEP